MSPCTPNLGSRPPRRLELETIRTGFTLIELMVVISVVGVLIAVLLPSLSSMVNRANSSAEMAAARQLSQGYTGYATDNNGRLMPGYLSNDPSNEDFEDAYDIQGPTGALLDGPSKRRWTWRILPYLGDSVDALFVNQGRQYIDELRGTDDFAYIASVYPSFGLNSEWLGGMKGSVYGDLHTLGEFTGECYYSQRLAEIQRPSEQLVFASSRGPQFEGNGNVEGYFYLLSPHYHTTGPRWEIDDDGEPSADASKNGFISARHDDKAVTTMLDGSTKLERLQDLNDMRRWANDAWKADWVIEPQMP